MSNPLLAKAGVAAVTDDALDPNNPNYPDDPGVKRKAMCSRFCRCATRKLYKQKYQGLFGGSAIETGENFRDAGFAVKGPPQMGDFLIKMRGSGGFGHIEMFIGSNPGHPGNAWTAGNSSSSIGRVSGAKGFKTLAQFGSYDILARLPTLEEEERANRLFYQGRQIAVMPIREGKSYCKVQTWAQALGYDLDWDAESGLIYINGEALPANASRFDEDGRAFVWIEDLRRLAGKSMSYDPASSKVVVA